MPMLRSIAVQTVGAAFNAAVGFALLAFLGRMLAPASFGAYVSLLSFAVVALVVVSGGNPTLLYRDTAASGNARDRIGLAVAQVCGVGALGTCLAGLTLGVAAALAMACVAAIALADLVSAQLRGHGRFAAEALWQAACRLASAAAIVAAVFWLGPQSEAIFFAWFAATCLMLGIWGWRWLRVPRLIGLRAHLALALPLVILDALTALITKGDVALLATAIAPEQLADYAVCSRFTEAALLAFAPVCNVQMRYLTQGRQQAAAFDRTWRTAVATALGFGTLVVGAGLLAGDWVVPAIFGPAYASAGRLLLHVALSVPSILASLVLAQALLALERERMVVGILACSAVAWILAMQIGARHSLVAAADLVALVHALTATTFSAVLLRLRHKCSTP